MADLFGIQTGPQHPDPRNAQQYPPHHEVLDSEGQLPIQALEPNANVDVRRRQVATRSVDAYPPQQFDDSISVRSTGSNVTWNTRVADPVPQGTWYPARPQQVHFRDGDSTIPQDGSSVAASTGTFGYATVPAPPPQARAPEQQSRAEPVNPVNTSTMASPSLLDQTRERLGIRSVFNRRMNRIKLAFRAAGLVAGIVAFVSAPSIIIMSEMDTLSALGVQTAFAFLVTVSIAALPDMICYVDRWDDIVMPKVRTVVDQKKTPTVIGSWTMRDLVVSALFLIVYGWVTMSFAGQSASLDSEPRTPQFQSQSTRCNPLLPFDQTTVVLFKRTLVSNMDKYFANTTIVYGHQVPNIGNIDAPCLMAMDIRSEADDHRTVQIYINPRWSAHVDDKGDSAASASFRMKVPMWPETATKERLFTGPSKVVIAYQESALSQDQVTEELAGRRGLSMAIAVHGCNHGYPGVSATFLSKRKKQVM